MKQIVHNDYSYLDKIEWSENVQNMVVSFHHLTGDRIGQRIDIPVQFNHGKIWDALIENKVFVDNEELKAKVLHRTDQAVKNRIAKAVTNYNNGVDIYNALTKLEIKDKRRDSYTDGRFDGKIKPSEIIKTDYEDYLSEIQFSFKLDCDYDYDYRRYEGRYTYKNSYAHESVTSEYCNIEIKFDVKSSCEGTGLFYKVPHFTLDFVFTNRQNQEDKIDLIRSSAFDKVWKNGKHHTKMTFQSYQLRDNSRYVNLNTFLIYAREKSQTNKDIYKREIMEATNQNKVQQEITDKYPNANVFVENYYKRDLTHHDEYWGRYGKDCICVEFKDKSYILYSIADAKNGDQEIIGVYDSEYRKPEQEDLIELITNRN